MFQVLFVVDNGNGPITASVSLSAKNSLCDGDWHTIRGVKEANMVTLYVDNMSPNEAKGGNGAKQADTNDPLYIGGLQGNEILNLFTL